MLKEVHGGTSGKESDCRRRRCRRPGFNPWVRKIPGVGNGNTLQYSCRDDPMDRGTLVGYKLWGRKELDTTEAT